MKNPFRSLAARIVFFVFAVTLVTSLTVTGVSVNSIDSFLRSKINQRFPAVLETATAELDDWYDQRLREIDVFSKSEVLQDNLSALALDENSRRRKRARAEIEQYIAYVLAGFPQYGSLFVLGSEAELLLSVGEPIELSREVRDELWATDTRWIGDVLAGSDPPLQIASAPLVDSRGRSLGSLHALVRLEALREVLQTDEAGPSGRLSLISRDAGYLATSTGNPLVERFTGPLPSRTDSPVVLREYSSDSGEWVVGGARTFPRFGWTIVVEQPYAEAFAPVVSAIGRVLLINLAIVLFFGLAAFRVAVSIVRPIDALSDAAKRISDGERGVSIPESQSADEVGVLTRAFNDMTMRLTNNAAELEASHNDVAEVNERLRLQNDELQRVNEVLEQLSITDGLTKLHNHRYFQEALLQESKRADRTGSPLSLILIDIDYFKRWNDDLGHAAGDQILRQLAEVMNDLVRDTDRLARYGGEEFALIAPNTDLEGAIGLAEKIRAAVAATTLAPDTPGGQKNVTVSIGVASFAGDRRGLFNQADRALYQAKASGRDCVVGSNELL